MLTLMAITVEVTSYAYDDAGRIIRQVWTDGQGHTQTITNTYDVAGRLAERTVESTGT